MTKKISRRTFLKKGTALGVGSVIGSSILVEGTPKTKKLPKDLKKVDLSVVTGKDYFANTIKAVNLLGGMGRFNIKNAKVAILINSSFSNPGTIVNPDIALAVLKLCVDAGARDICCVPSTPMNYWNRSGLADTYEKELNALKSSGSHVKVAVKGKHLKEAEVAKGLLESDILINIPIAKDHAGTHYTGVLKNMMGACPYSTNRFFHYGEKGSGETPYEDVAFLSQCIADLNLLRKADLCVVDATRFITTNGPFGPGKMKTLHHVVAGTDGVMVDAYCCSFLGLKAKDVAMINFAQAHGIGKTGIGNAVIKTLET